MPTRTRAQVNLAGTGFGAHGRRCVGKVRRAVMGKTSGGFLGPKRTTWPARTQALLEMMWRRQEQAQRAAAAGAISAIPNCFDSVDIGLEFQPSHRSSSLGAQQLDASQNGHGQAETKRGKHEVPQPRWHLIFPHKP
jgi:hypothetical protein